MQRAGVRAAWRCDASPDGLAEAVHGVIAEQGHTLQGTTEQGSRIAFRTRRTPWSREVLCDARIRADGSGSRLEVVVVGDGAGSPVLLGRTRTGAVLSSFLDQVAAKV